MPNQAEKYDDDDGRVICNMNVEGMPWYQKKVMPGNIRTESSGQADQLTPSEARRFTLHAVLASMLIVSVFAVGWVLFILFCTQVWFR